MPACLDRRPRLLLRRSRRLEGALEPAVDGGVKGRLKDLRHGYEARVALKCDPNAIRVEYLDSSLCGEPLDVE
jgi:hypothetical protein